MAKRRWSAESPNRDGFYWLWLDGNVVPELICVTMLGDGRRRVTLAQRNAVLLIDEPARNTLYCGPLSVPRKPGGGGTH